MYVPKILLLLAPWAAAFTIPKGQPDGLYSVSTASDGTETHTLIMLHNSSSVADPPSTLSTGPLSTIATTKRQIPNVNNDHPVESVSCGGYYLDPGNTDRANGLLDAQCRNGNTVGADKDFYSIYGCTVSYFCNTSFYLEATTSGFRYVSTSTGCWASDRFAVSIEINRQCGGYGAGWDVFSTADNRYNGQYGWEDQCNHNSFCGRGTKGK